jgi:alpha-beta hydrolase superfamily lysophospholipase
MAKTQGLSERIRIKARFNHDDFDFFFQWLMGTQTNGGVETGEALFAASKIEDGNTESWHAAWLDMAARVEKRANGLQAKKHRVSAREAYLRATMYYRAPLVFMSPSDPRHVKIYQQAVACFRNAAKLSDPEIEVLEIPYGGKLLPGYFIKAAEDAIPRRTLLMFGGGDTYVEDLYYYIAPSGVRRGYNVMIADLPGQGMLPHDGLVMPVDAERPMKAIVDHALSRPDVDPDTLSAFGISAGGYLIPRAATVEKRLKAVIASSAILNFGEVWTRNSNLAKFAARENSFLFRMLSKLNVHKIEALLRLIETYEWRWGANSAAELVEKSNQFVYEPRDIECPLLVLIGEQEYSRFEASREWAHRSVDEGQSRLNNLVITPQNEGADLHAIGSNLSLMAQEVFDWLDEIFA